MNYLIYGGMYIYMKQNILNLRQNKISYWVINAILNYIIRLVPRNKKIWIYGSWLGYKYQDNSKYMFEYVNKTNSGIKHIWITKNKNIVNYLQRKGYEAYYYLSLKGLYYQIRAGVVFFTNSHHDINDLNLISGAYKVSLWHGMPLKRLYWDDRVDLPSNKLFKHIKLCLKMIKWNIYSNVSRDLTIASSNFCLNSFRSAFRLKNTDDVLLVGQPRNYILLTSKYDYDKKKFLSSLNINIGNNNFKIITYMPTYRRSDRLIERQNNLIKELLSNYKLQTILKEFNCILLVKFHELANNDIKLIDNVYFLNNDQIDVQELLKMTDILVTDYSSCFIDYALVNRPIIFLANDIKEYERFENGFYVDYYLLAGKLLAQSVDEFVFILKDILTKNLDYYENIKYINSLFNEFESSNSCSIIVDYIKSKLKIKED